jgi:hypothetical protein
VLEKKLERQGKKILLEEQARSLRTTLENGLTSLKFA